MINEEDAQSRETALQETKGFSFSAEQMFPGNVQLSKNSLITILICAGLSVIFLRFGFLSFFYLVPVGFAVIVTGSIWIPFFSAAGLNIIVDFISRSFLQNASRHTAETPMQFDGNSSKTLIEIFYFSSMFLLFVWIIGAKKPRTVYRLLAGSAAGAVVFVLLIYKTDFFSYLHEFIEELNAQFAEGDNSINPALLALIPADKMTELFNVVLLRGAALFSVLFIFYINRHIAYIFVALIKKRKEDKPLTEFFAPQNSVWALSGALVSILIANFLKIELLEILAWNVFVIYATIFLAQGAGILTHLLYRRSAGFRLGALVFFVIVLFSPLSMAAFVMLFLLGIIENWIPIRRKKYPESPANNG